ncbi:MAG: NfeD family protein [Pseudomonadota bacterium]
MVWWGWIVLGLLLMAAELALIDAAFYLLFIGLSAVLTGVLLVAGIPMALWLQWVVFGVTGAVTAVLFRQSLYDKLRGQPIGFEDQVDGRQVAILEDVAAGDETRVEFRGSRWDATNVGSRTLKAGEKAIILKASGSRLEIDARA